MCNQNEETCCCSATLDLTVENLKSLEPETPVAEEVETEEELEYFEPVELDEDTFTAGVRTGSYIGGLFRTLLTCGIEPAQAIDLILNERTIEHNQEMAKLGIKETKKVDVEKEATCL